MHKEMPDGQDLRGESGPAEVSFPKDYELHPLVRLRQLAEEIHSAARRNDLEVVCLAANLLAPTVERCKDIRDRLADSAGEAAQIAIQTQSLLADCETVLTQTLRAIAAEMRRIQQGKRALTMARRKPVPGSVAGNLNALR